MFFGIWGELENFPLQYSPEMRYLARIAETRHISEIPRDEDESS